MQRERQRESNTQGERERITRIATSNRRNQNIIRRLWQMAPIQKLRRDLI